MERKTFHQSDCAFCNPAPASVPLGRVLDKVDEALFRKKFNEAIRLLQYWIEESKAIGDVRAELSLTNELSGLYRKLGEGEKALPVAEKALVLCEDPSIGAVSKATAYLNCGTVYKAFGQPQKAVDLYRKAQTLYEAHLNSDDSRLAGLYNNMALALTDVEDYSEATRLYQKAIDVLSRFPEARAQVAITYCNLADLAMTRTGNREEAVAFLEKAYTAFGSNKPEDGNYAYACETCGPVFERYGLTAYAEDIGGRARSFYERP